MEKRKQILYSLITSLVVTVLIGAGALKRVDRWAQDALYQKPGVTSADIVIIGIDEDALEELGPYQTWDRNVMASALEALAADPSKKPAVTAIDVLYAGDTSEQADLRLAAAAQELGNVITASMAEFGEQVTWVDGHAVVANTSAVVGYLQPYEELRACTEPGHINAVSDGDGVMRHGVLYVDLGEHAEAGGSVEPAEQAAGDAREAGGPTESGDARVYSMSYRAAQMYRQQQAAGGDSTGAAPTSTEPGAAPTGAEPASDGSTATEPGAVPTGAEPASAAPAAADRLFYIPYTGKPGAYYDGVSIARVIRGEVPADYWAGRIVLIGPYAAALQDAYFTPIDKGEQMYGVEIQANMIQSFLENSVKKEIPEAPQIAMLFVLCAAAMAAFLYMEVLPAGLSAGALAAMSPVLAINLYRAGFVTHPLWGTAGVGAVYILAMAAHYVRAVRERQALALEKERTRAELALAGRIQVSALPKDYPDRPEFDLAASMFPAKGVGGDFYDFFMIDDDHLGLVIADVSGKGVPAALFMMVSSALIRHSSTGEYSPAKILYAANEQICARNPEEMFVTVWLGILEISTGRLTAANAGHEYPMLKKAGKQFEMLKDRHGLVIGAMGGARYRDYVLQLEPGEKLFVYTDGVAEAVNSSMEQFGTDRILETLHRFGNRSPKVIVAAMNRAVKEFGGDEPQFDDVTMLCVEYKGVREPE